MKRAKRMVKKTKDPAQQELDVRPKKVKNFLTSGQEFKVMNWIIAHAEDVPKHTTQELCEIFEQEHGFALTNSQLRRLAGEADVDFSEVVLRRPNGGSAKLAEKVNDHEERLRVIEDILMKKAGVEL